MPPFLEGDGGANSLGYLWEKRLIMKWEDPLDECRVFHSEFCIWGGWSMLIFANLYCLYQYLKICDKHNFVKVCPGMCPVIWDQRSGQTIWQNIMKIFYNITKHFWYVTQHWTHTSTYENKNIWDFVIQYVLRAMITQSS